VTSAELTGSCVTVMFLDAQMHDLTGRGPGHCVIVVNFIHRGFVPCRITCPSELKHLDS
jgi:hypothetical protein